MPSRDKKILFITPIESEFVKGGIASWTSKLQKNKLPDDYSFKIIDSAVLFKRGIFNFTEYNLIKEAFRTIQILVKLIYEIIVFRPKVLHLNSSISRYGVLRDLMCILVGKTFRLRSLIHFRGNLPQEWQKGSSFFSMILDTLISLSDGVIAINSSSLSFLKIRKEDNCIFKVESFIEDEVFEKSRNHSSIVENIQIIFIGAFVKEKGAEEILCLSNFFPDVTFNLVGQLSQEYKEIISSKNNIKSRGILSRNLVLDLLLECDILLFPSHSEGFPNVVLESMSLGIPVVASNVGAIPEMIVDKKGGYLSGIGEIQLMKSALEILIQSPEKRKEMGSFNRLRAKELYSYETVVNKLIKIYQA